MQTKHRHDGGFGKRFWDVPTLLALLTGLICVAAIGAEPKVKLINDGMEIDAGGVGKLVLEYPKLFDASQQMESRLIDKSVSGSQAELGYEGGSRLKVALKSQGVIEVDLSGKSSAVKHLVWQMQIPIGMNQGGSWKMGDQSAEFPVKKPEKNPHLFSGHAESMILVGLTGESLEVTPPKNSFLQLTDNREWEWSIFYWKAFTPLDAHGTKMELGLSMQRGSGSGQPLVDSLGQSTRSQWPRKVTDVEELKADVPQEQKFYAGLQEAPSDEFGGLLGSKEKLGLQATGFFHVEKKGNRWILVDPLGNAFFHRGVCVFNPNDDYTLIKGRENLYEWLPEANGEFASAFRPGSGGTIVSFHLVNQIRKYGEPFEPNAYMERMIGRVRKLGFTSAGAFTGLEFGVEARRKAKFPGVAHLPLNSWENVKRVPGIHETFDPFDEATREQIRQNMAAFLPKHANDPLIIGYYIVNEPIYEQIPVIVPSLKGSEHSCKRALVDWLETKYDSVSMFNEAWGMDVSAFEELLEIGLPLTTEAAKADSEAFASVFLEEYMRLVREEFRKHDPKHLLLGSRLQPGTIRHEWVSRVMGRHVDVMSFNYYTYGLDRKLLRNIFEWTDGKPMILSEFFWSSPSDSGLTGGRELDSQQQRGLAYRHYVEQTAALGFVVGIEWFTLVDQSVTGRWFSEFDGERANSGMFSVVDRPWTEMLEEMKKTNDGIYEVWLGGKPPFVWKDERFRDVE